jgi:hypothetical protein
MHFIKGARQQDSIPNSATGNNRVATDTGIAADSK